MERVYWMRETARLLLMVISASAAPLYLLLDHHSKPLVILATLACYAQYALIVCVVCLIEACVDARVACEETAVALCFCSGVSAVSIACLLSGLAVRTDCLVFLTALLYVFFLCLDTKSLIDRENVREQEQRPAGPAELSEALLKA